MSFKPQFTVKARAWRWDTFPWSNQNAYSYFNPICSRVKGI